MAEALCNGVAVASPCGGDVGRARDAAAALAESVPMGGYGARSSFPGGRMAVADKKARPLPRSPEAAPGQVDEPDGFQGHEVVGEGGAAQHAGDRVRAGPRRLPAQRRRQARRRLLLARMRWLPRPPPQDCPVCREEPGRAVPAGEPLEAQVHVLQPPCPCPPLLQVLQGSARPGQHLQLHQCNYQQVQGCSGEARDRQVQPGPCTGSRGVGAHGLGCEQGPAVHLRQAGGPCPNCRSHCDGGCRARKPLVSFASIRDAAAQSWT